MDWHLLARELLNVVGGFAALLNIAGILCLIFVKTQYKKLLKKHEHDLEVQLEAFKSSLEAARQDHAFAFAKLYERRESVLSELWKHLVHARRMAHDASAISPRCDFSEFLRTTQKAKEEFEQVEFYFPPDFCEQWYHALQNLEAATISVIEARKLRSNDWNEDLRQMRSSVDEFTRVFKATKGPLLRRIQELIKIEEVG